MSKAFFSGVLLLVLAFSCAARAEGPAPGQQSGQRLEVQIPIQMNFLLYLPEDYEKQEAWPLMLFLHGAGERGDDLEKVKIHGPPKLIAGGKQFPFIVVSPQCPQNKWWDPSELSALLDSLEKQHKVDSSRIYVTGLSMGGFGTWGLAAHSPNRFAAIAPICGGGDPFATRRYAHLPAWVFHGAKDPVVKLEQSQKMVDALQENGGTVKFTVYPEATHDSWTESYDNPELYAWLLEQKRVEK